MNLINVNKENIDTEHICCAISDKKGDICSESKKAWMKMCFVDGLVFKKLDARGKVFVEYIAAENAWCPIDAPNCFFIDCFWVSGQYKGQGYADKLLEACVADGVQQGKTGLVALSSKKKMPFLSDPGYLKYKGFQITDTAVPYYELLYLPLDNVADKKGIQSAGTETKPRFKDCCRNGSIDPMGIVLYYSNHCPHTEKYVSLIEKIAHDRGVDFTRMKFETKEQAQNAPAPFTTYSLFYDGQFVTNEILSENKFIKFLNDKGL